MRAVPTMLWIGDTPLESTGFELEQPSLWLDGVTRAAVDTTRATALTGGHYTPAFSAARTIGLVGTIIDVPMDQLQPHLARIDRLFAGLLPLRWPHAPTHVMYAKAGPVQVEAANPTKAFVRPDKQVWRLRVQLTCADGAIYDRNPQRVRLGTVPKPLLLGSGAVGGTLDINGPISGALDIDLLSPSRVIVERLALRNVALLAGEVGRIRFDVPTSITRIATDGTETPVLSWRDAGLSTRPWQVTPIRADQARNQFMHLRLSTGDGWYTYFPTHNQ